MQNIKIEEDKLKRILYDNLDMLFAKLGDQNEELEKIDSELKGGLA